jgi:hypothetical protein
MCLATAIETRVVTRIDLFLPIGAPKEPREHAQLEQCAKDEIDDDHGLIGTSHNTSIPNAYRPISSCVFTKN